MGDQHLLSQALSCFGIHVKLGPAAFAVVSSHQPALLSFFCIIHREGLCPSSEDINRQMMIMIYNQPWLLSKCNCSSQKPLLTTGIWTRDLWLRSLDLRPLDQPAVNDGNNYKIVYFIPTMAVTFTEMKISPVARSLSTPTTLKVGFTHLRCTK
jgi:hypothetical protein